MPSTDSIHEAIEVVSSVPYFASLDALTLESVARTAIRREYSAGQIILLEGEDCAGLYFVQDGWLKVARLSPTGREQILRVIGPGEVCNEISVFAGSPNPASVIALEDAAVWIIQRETILRLLDEVPGVAQMVAQNMAKRVLHLLTLVEDLSLRTVEARMARLLLERATDGILVRRRWATQTEMAARLGTVPDVTSRVLRTLADEGMIRVTRHEIQILDSKGLEAKTMSGE